MTTECASSTRGVGSVGGEGSEEEAQVTVASLDASELDVVIRREGDGRLSIRFRVDGDSHEDTNPRESCGSSG